MQAFKSKVVGWWCWEARDLIRLQCLGSGLRGGPQLIKGVHLESSSHKRLVVKAELGLVATLSCS